MIIEVGRRLRLILSEKVALKAIGLLIGAVVAFLAIGGPKFVDPCAAQAAPSLAWQATSGQSSTPCPRFNAGNRSRRCVATKRRAHREPARNLLVEIEIAVRHGGRAFSIHATFHDPPDAPLTK